MSYSTMYGLWPGTEKRVKLVEFRNAWGLAPLVWNVMAQKYLSMRPYAYMQRVDDLWLLHAREDVPVSDRAVLRMTFDTAYIADADRARAIGDIALFLHAHNGLIDPKAVNHWSTFAWHLAATRADPPPAIGVHQTSVSRNPWQGPFNEEKDAYEPFDWTTAYSVYAAERTETP